MNPNGFFFSMVPDQEAAHQVLISGILETGFIFHCGSQHCEISVNIETSFFFQSKKKATKKKKKLKQIAQLHQDQSLH